MEISPSLLPALGLKFTTELYFNHIPEDPVQTVRYTNRPFPALWIQMAGLF